MDLEMSLSKVFDDEKWNGNVKVVQKDMNYMFRNSMTESCKIRGHKIYHHINCLDWLEIDYKKFSDEIIDTKFIDKFDRLCKTVIDKDFIMFRSEFDSNKSWIEQFVEESHGTGVCSLLYMLYEMESHNCNHIVIDSIDGILHPLSMERLCQVLKNQNKYKVIFLMNNDTLFTNLVMDIKDLYILDKDVITNVQKCTDRELKPSHNLQVMLRAGEFTNKEQGVVYD